jgi:hypothetical protein
VVLRRVDPEPIGRIRNFWASSALKSDSGSETVFDLFAAAEPTVFKTPISYSSTDRDLNLIPVFRQFI